MTTVRRLRPRPVARLVGTRHRSNVVPLALVATGAVTVVLSAVVHLRLWGQQDGYRAVPKIGPLFLLQGIVGCVLGVAMVAFRRVALTALGAVYMALSLGGLAISINGELFGYPETLGAPYVKVSLVDEAIGLAVCLLACGWELVRSRAD